MTFLTSILSALPIFILLPACRAAPIANSTIPATYTIASGDSLSTISSRYNTTLQALEACNPQIVNPDLILPGQILSLPQPSLASQITSESTQTYTVVAGDTFSLIAAKVNIPLEKLEAANPQITDPDLIIAGQVINLPTSSSDAVPAPSKYTVMKGDTLTSIAQKLNTTVSALEKANPSVKNPDFIVVGQILEIPAKAGAAAAQVGGTCGKLP